MGALHPPRPLPVKVLEVVQKLGKKELRGARQSDVPRQRQYGPLRVLGSRQGLSESHTTCLPIGDDRGQSAGESGAGGVGLVDYGIQRGSHRQIQLDRQAGHGYRQDRRVEPPLQNRPWAHDQNEDGDGGCCENGHQVVAYTQGENERHEDQQIVIPALPYSRLPAERQPGQQRDREQQDGIHLLVDVRLTPHGEGRRTEEHGHQGAGDAEAVVPIEVSEDVMHDKEPQSVGCPAHESAEEVDAHRDRET